MCSDNILYYHNKILTYIKHEIGSFPSYIDEIKELIISCYKSLDMYGILDEDKEFIELNKEYYLHGLKIKKITKKKSYKEFKDNITSIKKTKEHIEFINTQNILYNISMNSVINKYKTIIKTPIKNSFIGKKKEDDNDELMIVVEDFTNNIKSIFPESILQNIFKDNFKNTYKTFSKNTDNYCENCNNYKQNNTCYLCGNNTDEGDCLLTSYDDIGRINVNKQFTYEKRCHFRDTMNQYQGKQNKQIPSNVLEALYTFIDKEGLCDKKKDDKIDRYKKVKKSHIREFLKSTGYAHHYEDLQLIYSIITGNKCPCITSYEKQLYEDFESLTLAFLSVPNVKRDNFLNSHYVLRQLLLKQGVTVPYEDLNYLKTPNRLREHDEIYKTCCNILNWNFRSMS